MARIISPDSNPGDNHSSNILWEVAALLELMVLTPLPGTTTVLATGPGIMDLVMAVTEVSSTPTPSPPESSPPPEL